jgi:hypothetical protein
LLRSEQKSLCTSAKNLSTRSRATCRLAPSLDRIRSSRSATRMVYGRKTSYGVEHDWHDTGVFAGVVADRGHLEIRSFHRVERKGCFVILTSRIALDDPFLKQLPNAAGLQTVDTGSALLGPYRAEEGIRGKGIWRREIMGCLTSLPKTN